MIEQAIPFLEETFCDLNKHKVDLFHWVIDHLCYRTTSLGHYQQTLDYFKTKGQCLTESTISGRPIATIKLTTPLRFREYIIDLIEIPAPKNGQLIQEGFEHFEVVVDQHLDKVYDQLSHLASRLTKKYSGLNPELVLKLDNYAIKFHYKSLEQVIHLEQQTSIMSFLNETGFLEVYRDFSPCLSGTYPLDLAIKGSDLDILLNTHDLQSLESKISNDFSSYDSYHFEKATYQEQESLICSFCYQELDIELFAQHLDSYQQQANIHMLVEGRLLKLLGSEFKEEITHLKNKGYKTEPAFGKALDLPHPYEDLKRLHFKTDQELLNLFSETKINLL